MNIIAHIRELVVEGEASFTAQQFQEQLAEQLAALDLSECGEVVLGELVVHAAPSLRGAAEAAARAIGEKVRGKRQ